MLHEVTIVGDALLAITNALRINYEILGNRVVPLLVLRFPT